ncbi:MAG: AMP-binding protein, partial [Alphaproteobacteria bacterium]
MATSAQSYVHGASSAPLIGDTIGEHLDRVVARWPDHDALIVGHQKVRWSYGDLAREAADFAAGLLALGLEPGDRIGIWSPNNAEWVVTQFATAKAGLVLVNINPAYRVTELDYALNKVGCKALVTARRFKSSDYLAMLAELGRARLPRLETIIRIGDGDGPGTIPFAEVATRATATHRSELARIGARLQFDDAINIQFTSGTTGAPKGVMLTHDNVCLHALGAMAELGLADTDSWAHIAPMFHLADAWATFAITWSGGRHVVLPQFDADAALELIAAE